jgi:alpha-glucosidase
MAADLPENYEGNEAFGFIHDLPSTWDETIILKASIGEYIVTARRKGNNWYIGAITNETAREISIPLSMLSSSKTYIAKSYTDSPDAHFETNPEAIEIKTTSVNYSNFIQIKLAAGGGAAIRLTEKQ